MPHKQAKAPDDDTNQDARDPFDGLRFAACIGLLGVVVFLVGVGLDAAVRLYAGTLP